MQNYKIAHSMIRVLDPKKSVDFYEKALGFHTTKIQKHPEDAYDLYFLSDPDETCELELTYNYGHEPYDLGTGYGHIALYVDDLEQSWKDHEAMGLNPGSMTRPDGTPKGYYFISDPDGYEIEIIQARKN